jgi:hypothetical protein
VAKQAELTLASLHKLAFSFPRENTGKSLAGQ